VDGMMDRATNHDVIHAFCLHHRHSAWWHCTRAIRSRASCHCAGSSSGAAAAMKQNERPLNERPLHRWQRMYNRSRAAEPCCSHGAAGAHNKVNGMHAPPEHLRAWPRAWRMHRMHVYMVSCMAASCSGAPALWSTA
jgi:hypothetical protein